MIDANSVPEKRLDARVRNYQGNVIVGSSVAAVELNQVALRIWQLVDGRRTVAEIGAELAQEFDVEAGQATEDTRHLLGELEEIRAINVAPATA